MTALTQIKLGSVTGYEPATERGEGVQEAQQELSFVEDARERFDAARTAYSEARELGFSRTRSAYEAAREALLFGVESEIEKPTIDRHLTQDEPMPLRGMARLKARRAEREELQSQRQERETLRPRKRESEREESIWDALDGIGREQSSAPDQREASDAIQRVQERTTEQQQEREIEVAEKQRLEREEQEREQGRDNDAAGVDLHRHPETWTNAISGFGQLLPVASCTQNSFRHRSRVLRAG